MPHEQPVARSKHSERLLKAYAVGLFWVLLVFCRFVVLLEVLVQAVGTIRPDDLHDIVDILKGSKWCLLFLYLMITLIVVIN